MAVALRGAIIEILQSDWFTSVSQALGGFVKVARDMHKITNPLLAFGIFLNQKFHACQGFIYNNMLKYRRIIIYKYWYCNT